MDLVAEVFEMMVNSYDDEDELMNFAATWGMQDSQAVQFRLFQLRNPEYNADTVNEQLDSVLATLGGPLETVNEDDLEMAATYVTEQEEIEGAVKALLFDEEMDETERLCIEDGEWEPPIVQRGSGEEPQAGPSHTLKYSMRKKSERTFAKTAAVDRTYQVKVDERYHGQHLGDVREGLHGLFQDVLHQARGNLAGNDLGRVVIHHNGLHDPIVVPLRAWDDLNADRVMEMIQRVLNSNETLSIDHSFEITIGTIDLPKGGARRRITRIKGPKNSLQLKSSLVTIDNGDQLCMARAIGVSWAKLKRCTPEEWKEVTKNRRMKSNLQLILEAQKVPLAYYNKLMDKQRKEQGQLATTLSQLAGVPMDRPASLNDVTAFEELLGVRVMVVSARLGNKFITGPSTDERPCIYLYLVDDDHFHAITSITGFFSAKYLCDKCLKHYDHREHHQCDEKCIVCKRDRCPQTNQTRKCTECNMTCRSDDCYQQHEKIPVHARGRKKGQPRGPSQCQKYWKCPTCYKVVRTDKRNKLEHECGEYYCKTCETYVMDDHKCYLRANECKQDFIPKYVYFDFECSQDEMSTCQEGYRPNRNRNCTDCQPSRICKSCSKCQHCRSSWCGKATHLTNVICSAHLGCAVRLRRACYQLANARYDPARFPGLIWQHRSIGGNCLVFSNGTIQCQGKASSLREGMERLRQYARILQTRGWPVVLDKIKVISASGFHILSGALDLDTLVPERRLIYEPELFPAANLTLDGVTFCCFSNGKIVITGIKKRKDIDEVVVPALLELELYTT